MSEASPAMIQGRSLSESPAVRTPTPMAASRMPSARE